MVVPWSRLEGLLVVFEWWSLEEGLLIMVEPWS